MVSNNSRDNLKRPSLTRDGTNWVSLMIRIAVDCKWVIWCCVTSCPEVLLEARPVTSQFLRVRSPRAAYLVVHSHEWDCSWAVHCRYVCLHLGREDPHQKLLTWLLAGCSRSSPCRPLHGADYSLTSLCAQRQWGQSSWWNEMIGLEYEPCYNPQQINEFRHQAWSAADNEEQKSDVCGKNTPPPASCQRDWAWVCSGLWIQLSACRESDRRSMLNYSGSVQSAPSRPGEISVGQTACVVQ